MDNHAQAHQMHGVFLQALEAAMQHKPVGDIVSQFVEDAPAVSLHAGIDDVSPTGELTPGSQTPSCIKILDASACQRPLACSVRQISSIEHRSFKHGLDLHTRCASGACQKEAGMFCLGVEPGEHRLANCLRHQLDQEALPDFTGTNKW